MDKTGCRTYIDADFLDDSYKYFAYNNGKFYAANNECIRIFAVKLTSMEAGKSKTFPVQRKIEKKDAAVIQLYDESTQVGSKIHGISVTSDGRESRDKDGVDNDRDFVQVYIEIAKENKISINELRIKNGCLPPYKFEYQFIEWREYIHRAHLNDPIERYQFVFNKHNRHAGVAKRKSGGFDIYYNGNYIDTATNSKNGKPTLC